MVARAVARCSMAAAVNYELYMRAALSEAARPRRPASRPTARWRCWTRPWSRAGAQVRAANGDPTAHAVMAARAGGGTSAGPPLAAGRDRVRRGRALRDVRGRAARGDADDGRLRARRPRATAPAGRPSSWPTPPGSPHGCAWSRASCGTTPPTCAPTSPSAPPARCGSSPGPALASRGRRAPLLSSAAERCPSG